MGRYDFDTVVDRHGTGSLKYDCAARRGKSPDLLPLWVADMDFPTAPAVVQAIKDRADQGIFGYTEPDEAYVTALRNWFGRRYGFWPEASWLTVTPGVVFALAQAVRAFSAPGDAVLIQPPVYYPFSEVVEDNGRRLVEAPLAYDASAHTYAIDFDAFERTVAETSPKIFLLCNPHNPAGRVWSADELRRLGAICNAHRVLVVSDEIHADFARPGFAHIVYPTLGAAFRDNCLVCTAATKSFNLAGLQASNIFIPNPQLKERFDAAVAQAGYSQPNCLGLVATRAAYEQGEEWLEELKAYLDGNYQFMVDFLAARAPQLAVVPLESTYLVWVDCRALGLDDEGLTDLVEGKAGLWLDMGYVFGEPGRGFIRFNIACPRSVLARALDQLAAAL